MTSSQKQPSQTTATPPSINGNADLDIDLRDLSKTLLRHKALITFITGGCLLVSSVYAFTTKPIWEGSFQIVLEERSSGITNLLSQDRKSVV